MALTPLQIAILSVLQDQIQMQINAGEAVLSRLGLIAGFGTAVVLGVLAAVAASGDASSATLFSLLALVPHGVVGVVFLGLYGTTRWQRTGVDLQWYLGADYARFEPVIDSFWTVHNRNERALVLRTFALRVATFLEGLAVAFSAVALGVLA